MRKLPLKSEGQNRTASSRPRDRLHGKKEYKNKKRQEPFQKTCDRGNKEMPVRTKDQAASSFLTLLKNSGR